MGSTHSSNVATDTAPQTPLHSTPSILTPRSDAASLCTLRRETKDRDVDAQITIHRAQRETKDAGIDAQIAFNRARLARIDHVNQEVEKLKKETFEAMTEDQKLQILEKKKERRRKWEEKRQSKSKGKFKFEFDSDDSDEDEDEDEETKRAVERLRELGRSLRQTKVQICTFPGGPDYQDRIAQISLNKERLARIH